MANATLVPEGRPPELGTVQGPASTWIPEDEALTKPEETYGIGNLEVTRCSGKSLSGLMGKCWRNCVTGQVEIKRLGKFPDFCVADLWTRPHIRGTCEQLAMDPYLFRPIPLNMRT